MPRYQVTTDRNDINHLCCNRAAVLDTERTSRVNRHVVMCECLDVDAAEIIAAALNKMEP